MIKVRLSVMLLLAGFLVACNSTESTLNVQGQTTGEQTTAAAATPPAGASPAAAAPQASAMLKPGKLQIAPLVGAPVNIVTPLTHRMNDVAKTKGIVLAGSNDKDAAYVIRGYFSALAENNQTTILYVWDITDAAGNRLHRIQGQEKVPGAAADSWSVVTPATMQAIADKTMQEYASWFAANKA
ncbi:hypothetical protein ACFO1V_06510 [Daeguia caeni]|uniref:Lipoprotein n=1 Tax=Daeguia caeni TaxID=439612 RepID=A0ABV9H3T5_9HYPH